MEISGETNDTLIGNTKKRVNQLTSWFFTLNNYTKEDIESLKTKFEEICDKYIFEEEVGEICKTPHLQGVIFLKKKARWSEFNLTNRIKWLPTKNEDKAVKYCQKDFHYHGRPVYYKGITLKKPYEIPYRTTLVEYLDELIGKNELDKRKVHWFWSKKGECGKTCCIKYFYEKYKYVNLMSGCKTNSSNMLNLAFHHRGEEPVFIINVPRSYHLDKDAYIALESIKDGILTNYKSYENSVKIIRRPIIIVMANYAPVIDDRYMSKDRFAVYNIDYMDEIKNRDRKY